MNLTWTRHLCFAVAGLLVSASGQGQERDEARRTMERVVRQWTATDEVVEIEMELVDSSGRVRRRTATLYAKKKEGDDDMRLIRFHTPADLKRSAVLTIEHSDRDSEQWMYLPAYHTSRRVASGNRKDTWMGTDFSYEDMSDPKTEQYDYEIIDEEELRGVDCLVIEAVPIDEKLARESGYAKTVYWVDRDKDIALQMDLYNASGEVFKRLVQSELQEIGGYYRWRRVEMRNLSRDHATILVFSNRRIDEGLSNRYFTVRYLERGE